MRLEWLRVLRFANLLFSLLGAHHQDHRGLARSYSLVRIALSFLRFHEDTQTRLLTTLFQRLPASGPLSRYADEGQITAEQEVVSNSPRRLHPQRAEAVHHPVRRPRQLPLSRSSGCMD